MFEKKLIIIDNIYLTEINWIGFRLLKVFEKIFNN